MKSNQNGFLLIGLMITIALIAVLVVIYLKPTRQDKQNIRTINNQAQQQLKESNQKLQDYQNQLQENQ